MTNQVPTEAEAMFTSPLTRFLKVDAGLTGGGTLYDDGESAIDYEVHDIPDEAVMKFRLALGSGLQEWKTLPIYSYISGNWAKVTELGVSNNHRVSSVNLGAGHLTESIKLDFWRKGFLVSGHLLRALPSMLLKILANN